MQEICADGLRAKGYDGSEMIQKHYVSKCGGETEAKRKGACRPVLTTPAQAACVLENFHNKNLGKRRKIQGVKQNIHGCQIWPLVCHLSFSPIHPSARWGI